MAPVPLLLSVFFGLTVVVTLWFFTKATNHSRVILLLAIGWLVLQSVIGLTGFYRITNVLPPRLLLAAGPPLLVILLLFFIPGGKRLMDGIDLKWATLLHSVRMLVEITLYFLYVYRQVPGLMTIEGGNVDFLAGLSAPLIWWAYNKGHVGRRGLLIWNFVSLASVLNAVVRAQLSAPFPFQRLAFDQPTVAIFYFPFVLLIAFVVPVVLFCHAAVIRKLMREKTP